MASILELLPRNLTTTGDDADILLELAYLVTAVDGKLTDEELGAFGELVAQLHGAGAGARSVDAYLELFVDSIGWDRIAARVRALAKVLRPELHEVAYKLALGLAFIDGDPHREEDRLHAVLGDALGLAADRRAALSHEVSIEGGRAP
jgi:hypothetical protein